MMLFLIFKNILFDLLCFKMKCIFVYIKRYNFLTKMKYTMFTLKTYFKRFLVLERNGLENSYWSKLDIKLFLRST